MRMLRAIAACLVCLLPSFLKVPFYRMFFGYRIGRRVRIGWTPFVGVRRCTIGDGVRIGHFNAFFGLHSVAIGQNARIGSLNLFRGGHAVSLGAYTSVLRLNVFNSIPDAESVNAREPVLGLGAGATVTTGHWLDFTDRIEIGAHTIIGGRGSSLWTHNRQRTRPIVIGHHCYIGSEARFAPGANVAPMCIVALGSVLLKRFPDSFRLIGGNPARELRELSDRDTFLLVRRTRTDIPADLAAEDLPSNLREYVERAELMVARQEAPR